MRQEAAAVVAGIDNEEVNVEGLLDLAEVGIMGEGGSEGHPGVKEIGAPNPGSSHDAVVGHLCCREQFRAKSITGGNRHMRQGMSCEKQVLKSVRICESERS